MPHGPLKIVLIRAGRYDYAEVELGGSLQIVGPNNTGKTTLINTLQFLYVDDLRTMDFGSYSLEQTLTYYFPGPYSYVLFECLGAAGRCLLGWRGQSKTSGGDPERFTCLGAYDPDDFLDPARQVREPREVAARLALKEFRLVKSAQEQRELLLPPAGHAPRGLGLVALRDPDRFRRFRESLKDLLCLSTISQEQMRERLLTLADVRTDLPALDVRRLFGDDYDRIRLRRDGLARFKKQEDQVRQLVERFEELQGVRGDLLARWADLRERREAFEADHQARLAGFRQSAEGQGAAAAAHAATLRDRQADRDAHIGERGGLQSRLDELDRKAQQFADFSPDLAQASRQNLKREEQRLTRLLAEAETETRDKAQQKLAVYSDLVRQKESAIANFDRLAITALRRHCPDDELDRAFRLLNFGLLETPVGPDGITVRDQDRLLATVRAVAARVRDGVYEDDDARIVLPPAGRNVAVLANVERLREELKDHADVLARWQSILKAIQERDALVADLQRTQASLAAIERQIFGFEELTVARAEAPRLQRDLRAVADALARVEREIGELERQRAAAEASQKNALAGIVALENAYNEVMGRYGQCVFPEFSAPRRGSPDIPDDFDAAIAQFLHQQAIEARLRESVEHLLKVIAQLVGEEFNGADDADTVRNLAGELDALADKTEALERDWNALIQGLRGTFAGVLKELDAVRAVVNDLNRQFARVPVSNLRSLKLEVHESADIVSWIRRLVDLQQPGLFDDDTQLDQTLRNFRQKLEGSPLIGFSQLFSLGLTVEGEDNTRRHYHDLKQIESHGTTITVKVLFNLLVLRRYLREDQCLVPFFLDEVQALDPANRHAILATAAKLGFIAITAAPEAITEVDALYFLQPHQGRIILRHRHRLGVKSGAGALRGADA